jgi:hypothetical protein
MNVIISPEVRNYFLNLIITLVEKEYFSYYEDAERYVKDLVKDIKTNLPTKSKRAAPAIFNQGKDNMEYASFKKNRQTTWYAFFETYEKKGEIYYVVKRIENNHTAAHHL